MIAGMTYYQICWYFLFYSFCGWVIEVIFHAVVVGKVINRGFLNGPLCPVYGFGMLAVLAVSNLAGSRGIITLSSAGTDVRTLLLLFAGSMVFATLVELAAGWLLDMLFHMRWWDYSDKPLNFHGYICLEFSIIWGLAVTAVVLLVHPLMEQSRSFGIPEKVGWPLLAVLYLAAAADLCVTVAAVRGLNRRLEELDSLQKSMRLVSDGLSRAIGEGTIRTSQKIGEGQVQAALARAELRDAVSGQAEKLENRAAELARKKNDWQEAARQNLEKKMESSRAKLDERKENLAQAREELARKKQALEARRQTLLAELKSGSLWMPGRILKNVPELKHRDYRELLEKLKNHMNE